MRSKIDYLGATLIIGGVSILLIWVSLAGQQFEWASTTTALLVAAGVGLIAVAVYVEARVATEPVIPLRLFADRTTALATIASVLIGVAMFGSTVYLSQYFQLARGMSPTDAGLMSIAMVGGLLVSSIVSGRIISSTGYWKRWLVGGMVLVIIGLALLSTIDDTTNLVRVGVFMAVLGIGLGATMQNLVLAVQNNTAQSDMGAASSVVSFFRSMGGSIGVSVLGAILSSRVATSVAETTGGAVGHESHAIPDLSTLPDQARLIFEHAFGTATGHIFLVATPFAVLALVAVLFIREVPLRTTLDTGAEPAARADAGAAMTESRADSIRMLEQEVGVLIRRVRRVIGERARAVHESLQPASYLMLGYVAENGADPRVGDGGDLRHRQGRDQPAGPAPDRPRSGRAHPRSGRRTRDPAVDHRRGGTPDAGRRRAPPQVAGRTARRLVRPPARRVRARARPLQRRPQPG